MVKDQHEDHLSDRDASYGALLGRWMNMIGLTDGQLARAISVNRSYPGKIRRGDKLPSPETADAILNHLLETAEGPGWNGPHVLTMDERRDMEKLLRDSYDRACVARKHHVGSVAVTEPATPTDEAPVSPVAVPPPDQRATMKDMLAVMATHTLVPTGRSLLALADLNLRGAAKLEAFITRKGDKLRYDKEVGRLAYAVCDSGRGLGRHEGTSAGRMACDQSVVRPRVQSLVIMPAPICVVIA